MRARLFTSTPLLLTALALASCNKAPTTATDQSSPSGNAASQSNSAAPAIALVAKADAVSIASKDGGLHFDYGWPTEAASIPALDSWLRGHADSARKKASAMAANDQKSAKESDYPFREHSFVQHWSVAANTAPLLVLKAEGYTFTGGAHGMPFVSTILWDKAKQQRLATTALLDLPALAKTLKPRFCKALNDQREEKRGEPVPATDKGEGSYFNECVDMAKQEIVPISAGGNTLDTVQIIILPYEAGPYAEGTYTIDLPLDDAALAAVKPAWQGAFGKRERMP
jgi:hypothetical protein